MEVIKPLAQRVGLFVDVQNMYYSAKNIYERKVNFGEIMKTAADGRNLIRAIAYGIKTEAGEERAFFEALIRIGIETKIKDLQIFPGGMKKGDWDVGMAVDAIEQAEKLDAIVLITGDGDFAPLVEYLKVRYGCQVEVIAFGKSASQKLKEIADDFIDLCQEPKRYLMK